MWARAAHRISTVSASTCLMDLPDMTGRGSCNYSVSTLHTSVCVCVSVCLSKREVNSTLFLNLLVSSFHRHAWSIFRPLLVSLTLSLSTLSFLLSLFLLQASIPLSTPSGLCYLITPPLYQITEEEHKLTQSVREREREEYVADFRAVSTPDHRNVCM